MKKTATERQKSVAMRVTPELYEKLKKSAESNARSISQELGTRLEMSFRDDAWVSLIEEDARFRDFLRKLTEIRATSDRFSFDNQNQKTAFIAGSLYGLVNAYVGDSHFLFKDTPPLDKGLSPPYWQEEEHRLMAKVFTGHEQTYSKLSKAIKIALEDNSISSSDDLSSHIESIISEHPIDWVDDDTAKKVLELKFKFHFSVRDKEEERLKYTGMGSWYLDTYFIEGPRSLEEIRQGYADSINAVKIIREALSSGKLPRK